MKPAGPSLRKSTFMPQSLGMYKIRLAVLVVIAPGGLQGVAPQSHGAVLRGRFETASAPVHQQHIGRAELVEHRDAIAVACVPPTGAGSPWPASGEKNSSGQSKSPSLAAWAIAAGGAGTDGSRGPIGAQVNIQQAVAVVISRGHGDDRHRHVLGNRVLKNTPPRFSR